MKLYEINKDGFNIGIAKGKQHAIDFLQKTLEWDGVIQQSIWGSFRSGVLKVKTSHHEFTIEEAV